MAICKCKMCGGDLQITELDKVVECEYCGTTQTVPSADNEKKMAMFNRANKLRLNNEFDKAAGIYESITADFPEEAEAYWGIILCKYGIEYVDDPASGKKIPTCHRSSFDSLLEDDIFEQACENADAVARRIYRDEAKKIEEIRKGIIEVSSKEEPYDIFICYKETDEAGGRTLDSAIAQDVYTALTEKGYRVFFSRISLEDKLGVEYEPYIFAALNSAKIMLAFGTDFDYFNAPWVKNEWSRFLQLIANGEKKYLIPCYKDIDAYDMPKEFAKLQSQDMGKIGAIQDLLRGIEKILPKNSTPSSAAVQQTVSVSSANTATATTDSLLKRAFMFLEDGNWNEADEYCEKVLDINPECAEAYLGKLMAELKVRKKENLKDCKEPFDNKNNYQKVIRFGDEALKAEIRGYITFIKERNENARLAGIYDNAQCIMHNAKTENEYKKAAEIFESIAEFKDAMALAKKCREQAEISRKQKEEAERLEGERINNTVEAVKNAFEKKLSGKAYISPEAKQAELKKKLTELSALSAVFNQRKSELDTVEPENKKITDEISNLKDKRSTLGLFAGKEKKEIDRQIAELTEKIQGLEEQIKKLKNDLKGYASKATVDAEIDSIRKQIETLNYQIEAKKKMPASELSFEQAFKALNDDKVKTEFLKRYMKLYTKALMYNAAIGDTVIFGTYPQDKNGKDKTPIEWRVLAKKDNIILVISDKALDCQSYNTSDTAVTWETCSLRKWMNGTFINNAFSTEEQAQIISTTVSADKNPNYSTNPGNSTIDKVFLLSITEVNKYFSSNEDRKCVPTEYAIAQGAYTSSSETKGGKATCWWWLRSPGTYQNYAASVLRDGSVGHGGNYVRNALGCVHPALWISLE